MFSLAGSSLPDSTESLLTTIRSGFDVAGISGAKANAQGAWPALSELEIDLTDTVIEHLPPTASGAVTAEFSVEKFWLHAAPTRIAGAAVTIDGKARKARFGLGQGSSGGFATLEGADDGQLTVSVALAELEQTLQRFAAEAARQHGVDLQKLRLTITPQGPRRVALAAEVTVKAFVATAVVTLTGGAEIDDQLVARLSNLRFEGSGMMANLAGGFARPMLARLEGKPVPLNAFTGKLPLRDVEVSVTDRLIISARFGGPAAATGGPALA